jgi:hypothetical protein
MAGGIIRSPAKKELFQSAQKRGWLAHCYVSKPAMTPKPLDEQMAGPINPPEKMIFLGLRVWEELRILARLARGADPALTSGTTHQRSRNPGIQTE